MATTTRSRRGGFPWGLLLLAGAGYLLYQESKKSTATVTPGLPTLPPSTATTAPATPSVVTTTAAAQLQQPTTTDQQLVLQVAQQDTRPNFLVFAQTGTPADITLMANIIRNEWQVYGRCQTDACNQNWQYLVNKYNIR